MVSKSTTDSKTTFAILWALCFAHLFNDMFQSLIAAIYPMLKESLVLSFAQIGLITLTFQFTSSVFQPLVGWFTDHRPQPYSLPFGMFLKLVGVLMIAGAGSYTTILTATAIIGFGSAIFHPDASRLAFMASGGRLGLAQSLFQVGGNAGSATGPLLAAVMIAPYGQKSIAWLAIAALLACLFMILIGRWYGRNLHRLQKKTSQPDGSSPSMPRSCRSIAFCLGILLVLLFSKYVYMAGMSSYYTFYLIEKFDVSIRESQLFLFAFLIAVAVGTLIGGPVGDRIGRKYVIWGSILGVAPFTLLLPYASSLWATCLLSILIGLVLSSAFSAILVYAQELMPGRVGTVAGLFFGLAFGIGGIASVVLGQIADVHGLESMYRTCSVLPLLGLAAWFLPDLRKSMHEASASE